MPAVPEFSVRWQILVDGRPDAVNRPISLRAGRHDVVLYGRLRYAAWCADAELCFAVEIPRGGTRRVHVPVRGLVTAFSSASPSAGAAPGRY